MPNSRRPRTEAWRCRRHPKHRQPLGVCSLCLQEKLSQLSSSGSSSSCTTNKNIGGSYSSSNSSSVSSLSSEYCSSSGSSLSSPMHERYKFVLFGSGKSRFLKKSRSIAFAPRFRSDNNSQNNDSDCKNKKGFWPKLFGTRRRKKVEGEKLKHSQTVREIRIITT